MIRNSLLVAAFAVLLSLVMHLTGLVVLFKPAAEQADQAAPEPADAAAFEDFAEEALEPEEPLEVVEPEPFTEALVASDNPQEVEAPDTGTEAQNEGRIEPEEVVEADAASQGVQAELPQGAPDAVPDTAEAEPEETQDQMAALAPDLPDAPLQSLEADTPDITLEALEETPEQDTSQPEELLASAVTRSLRPPAERPTEEEPGAEDGAEDTTEPAGLAYELAATQRTGLDLLAEAGATALYGRESLSRARAGGNAIDTNYAGKVLMKLNRAIRVHKNERGNADIRFQILPDGSIGWIRVIRSNGTPGIKVAAAANVRSAAPFPRPPDGRAVELGFKFQSR